jgi:hypothetical protein
VLVLDLLSAGGDAEERKRSGSINAKRSVEGNLKWKMKMPVNVHMNMNVNLTMLLQWNNTMMMQIELRCCYASDQIEAAGAGGAASR